MQILIYINANDIIKFLINEAQKYLDIESIFSICTQVDHDCAIYILDLKEKNSNLFELDIGLLFNAISHYNEDVFVKMIKLHNFFDKKENIEKISNELKDKISTRMIVSLYEKLSTFLPKDKLEYFASLFNFMLENNK